MHGAIGRQLALTASIGVARGMYGTAEQVLADADVALYVAKTTGKDRYVVFESGMQTAAQDRLMLEMDLSEALEREQLYLVYQPTFDLQSERAIGAEALLRWRHPQRGVVYPDQFVPLAEDSGMIVPIGRWVLERACAQAAEWSAAGHAVGISVNVSGRQLDRDELIDDVRAALVRSGLAPSALTLEITESRLMRDPAATSSRLIRLKQLGVRVAIDDFGTGHSSLAYLREFPVDALKIDRSFIQGIGSSASSAALIQTLVRLGKTLNLETLAEGIEARDQLRALQRWHCDHGQGFLFAPALEVEEFAQFLDAQHAVGAVVAG
jgi:EAL domain-containing protein (putative c-di-GMP-specific phosphodiesterase class I)